MDDLNKRVTALSPTKQALLQKLLKEKAGSSSYRIIQPRAHHGPIPLSFAQERFWFLDQFDPGSAVHTIPIRVRLRGELNVPVLESSVNEIVRRHDVLRTRFRTFDGQPAQVIEPFAPLEIPLVDLTNLPETLRESEAIRMCDEEARLPFDLTQDLMLRIKLFRLTESDHIFFLNRHHITSDGWSLGVFMDELWTLYRAFSEGQPSPLPELPIQYADYAVWQREWLQGEELEKQLGYWRNQLQGVPERLDLPTDRCRPAWKDYRGAKVVHELPVALSLALGQLSRREGVTPFMTLLTAFQILLHRYTSETDIAIGSPIAGRSRTEVEGLLGCFLNTLVFRGDLSGNPSFLTLLQRTREQCMGAYAHQELPFELLVKELKPERNLESTPLFQVLFVLQNAWAEAVTLPTLQVDQPVWLDNSTAEFDLSLSMEQRGEHLIAELQYNTDLFDQETPRRMLNHFQSLLESIVADPEQTIATQRILTAAEQHQLLVEWNNTTVKYPQYHCIHQLIEQQVQRTPEAIAVVWENQKLTYQELNTKANQIAHYLRSLGVQPEVRVGICVERCLEMIVGILAIIKAGGAYLPLDPAYPPERLEFMLSDAQVPVILTKSTLVETLPHHQAQVICLDTDESIFAQQSSENPNHQTQPHNLAYIIYTSGSTGKPKGTMIEHRSLINAYLAWEDSYHLSSRTSSHLQMASFSFDVFSGDFVRSLCSGGKLVICPRDFLLDPKQLYTLMQQQKIDCAEFVPAVLRNLIQYLEPTNQNLGFMKLLVVGSDSWYLSEYQHIRSLCGDKTRLINSYGVSEATIDTTYFETEIVDLSFDRLTPIGRPFANNKVYLLDDNMQPVPIGVPGELYIGGAGLARGYLKRPDLTQERFIPHPFSSEPGARLYRTGDMVSYRPDGNLILLGRRDNQVKIRGFRIELAEIEAALTQHLFVKQCVVIIREDEPGDKRLVAYVVSEGTDEVSPGKLRQFLQQRLPLYMIPSAFVQLEALPLTPNGKLDRRALPNPHLAHCIDDKSFVSPRTELERQLVFIWEQVLNVTPIGVKDNFFELGGNSLLTIRLLYEIEKSLKQKIPVATLFQLATIEQMARCLENSESLGTSSLQIPTGLTAEEYQQLLAIVAGRPGKQVSPDSLMVAVREQGTKPPLFICANAYDEVFPLTKNLDENQPVYLLETGLWVTGNNESQIKAIAAHHVRDILLVQPEPPYLLGGYCFGGLVAYEIAQQLLAKGKQVDLVLLLERYGFNPIYQLFDRLDVFITDHWIHLSSLNFAGKLRYIQTNIKRLIWERFSKSPKNQEDKAVLAHPYQPQPYPGKVVLICSIPNRKDPVPLGRFIQIIPAEFTLFLFKRAGWTPHTLPNLKILTTRGDHVSITEEPHVKLLAKKIQAYIDDEQNH
ncbi:amino acid adenylation domain-containing protein [Allocoleopsis sp.]|uniref:non-ribosomal peptide synthetase n=1 Tax=Allocoleopsis sp. TaxID=3088169 RepID=UPI002FD4E494